jgi:hypothetical protein
MQKCAKKIHGEAHLHATFGPSTNVDKAQTHLGTDHMKAVIVDIFNAHRKGIRKRMDIGEHFTREIFPQYRICLSARRKRAMTNLNLYSTPRPHYKVAKI